jgi:hypothetical protein
MYTYPRPQDLPYPSRVLSNEGRFLEAVFSGQSESWPDRGAPERSMNWWPVERWEALRLALGARGALPREVGSPPASKGASQAPWRLPTLHHASAVRWWRSFRQTSDALRRENAGVWLFEN